MKKNVASQSIGCQLISKTDGSAVTTGTTTVYVCGDAGTQAAGSVGSGACTHEGNGYWTYAPAQAETNYDLIAFTFVNTSACNATVQVYTTYPQTGDNYARLGAPAGASVSADIAAIQADTNDIQTRLPAALVSGRIDASVGAMAAGVVTAAAIATDAIDNDAIAADVTAVIADAVWNAATATYGSAGSYGLLVETNLDAAVSSRSTYAGGAVASVTGNVGGNVVGSVGSVTGLTASNLDVAVSTLATAANLATVAGYIDTEVAAILAAVDTEVAAIKAKTDNLPAAFPTNFSALAITAGGIVDADVEAVTGDTGAAAKLKRVLLGNVTGTVGAASTTTSIVTSALNPAASVTDQYKGRIVTFDDATTTAALRGQSTDVTASTAGGVLTVTALTTAPSSGDTFTIS